MKGQRSLQSSHDGSFPLLTESSSKQQHRRRQGRKQPWTVSSSLRKLQCAKSAKMLRCQRQEDLEHEYANKPFFFPVPSGIDEQDNIQYPSFASQTTTTSRTTATNTATTAFKSSLAGLNVSEETNSTTTALLVDASFSEHSQHPENSHRNNSHTTSSNSSNTSGGSNTTTSSRRSQGRVGIRPFRLPEKMQQPQQQPPAAAARLPTDELYFWDAHDDDDKEQQLPPVTELNVSFHDFNGLEQQQQQQDEEQNLPQGDSLLSQLDGEHILQEALLVRQDEDLAFRQLSPRPLSPQQEEGYDVDDEEEEEVDYVRTMGNIEYFSSASTELQLLETYPTVSQSQEQEDPAAENGQAVSSHHMNDMYNCYNEQDHTQESVVSELYLDDEEYTQDSSVIESYKRPRDYYQQVQTVSRTVPGNENEETKPVPFTTRYQPEAEPPRDHETYTHSEEGEEKPSELYPSRFPDTASVQVWNPSTEELELTDSAASSSLGDYPVKGQTLKDLISRFERLSEAGPSSLPQRFPRTEQMTPANPPKGFFWRSRPSVPVAAPPAVDTSISTEMDSSTVDSSLMDQPRTVSSVDSSLQEQIVGSTRPFTMGRETRGIDLGENRPPVPWRSYQESLGYGCRL